MKYKIHDTKKFRKKLRKHIANKRVKKEEVDAVLSKLANDTSLEPKFRDHALHGEWKGYRECHIRPDLLLVYRKEKDRLILALIDLDSHSNLFN